MINYPKELAIRPGKKFINPINLHADVRTLRRMLRNRNESRDDSRLSAGSTYSAATTALQQRRAPVGRMTTAKAETEISPHKNDRTRCIDEGVDGATCRDDGTTKTQAA